MNTVNSMANSKNEVWRHRHKARTERVPHVKEQENSIGSTANEETSS